MEEFQILAALDILDGRAVRLRQGNFNQRLQVDDDPEGLADRLAEGGATWLHVVDLDGARSGRPVHTELIARIVGAVAGRASVEVGGGIRDEPAIETAFASGAKRVVLGTAALASPAFAGLAVRRFGAERAVVAIDVRGGRAVGQGWVRDALGEAPLDALAALAAEGVTTFEVTAIGRDGTLEGPDLDVLGAMTGAALGDIIASGGIRSVEDLESVRRVGCVGAIVGRALSEGHIDLAQAVTAMGRSATEARPMEPARPAGS